MRILHLSDLHYGIKYLKKIERMFPALLDVLEIINKESKIDLVVFTGDLVWSGKNIDSFNDVKTNIIEPLLKKLELETKDFIICPGNHDMSDTSELSAIKTFYDGINDNDELDKHVKKDDRQFELSFEKSLNYYEFFKTYYTGDNFEQLYQTFERVKGGKKIGIVAFNTAWRSFIGKHDGHLLIPIKIINDALSSFSDKKDIYISLMHHDINDLKDYNKNEVEDIIYEKFHINFSGHHHKKKQGAIATHDIGILSVSAMASMSGKNELPPGFSLIDTNIKAYESIITNYTYLTNDNVFVCSSKIEQILPMAAEKAKQVKFLKRLDEIYQDALLDSNSLLIEYDDTGDNSFLEYYNDPVVKTKSYYESLEKNKSLEKVGLDQLIESDCIIFGKDKFGKTSVLRKIQLQLLDDFINKKIIPIYFDLKNYQSNNEIKLTAEISRIFHVSKNDAIDISENNNILLLIDNYNKDNYFHVEQINGLIKEKNDLNFILTSEEIQRSKSYRIEIGNKILKNYYIHPLNKKSIKTQTYKMLKGYDPDLKHEIIDKTIAIFTQMNIPFSFWYVSLFLWIYKKEKNIITNDNVEMLNLYIDKLLERENIAKLNKNIDFDLFKKLLSELSYILLQNHADSQYSMTYAELVNFVTEFQMNNIRFVTGVEEIIKYLLDKRIIKQLKPNDKYTFRLNAVMEYFTAYYMKENKEFADNLIQKDDEYLNYANEIEIYAGLDRKNIDLLQKIHNKTEKILYDINNKYTDNPDNILKDKLKNSKEMAKIFSSVEFKSREEQEEYEDQPLVCNSGDVQKKTPYDCREKSLSQLNKYIFILSRTFRSLTIIDDMEQMDKTFNLILQSYINIGFEYIECIELKDEKTENYYENLMRRLISCLIPLITQMSISEAVLHKNLVRFIERTIERLEEDKDNNQYKLLILYYMLLDIGLVQNKEIIEKVCKNINMPMLKGITIIKFMYYLVLKLNGYADIEKILINKIANLQVQMNPGMNKGEIINDIKKNIRNQKHQ